MTANTLSTFLDKPSGKADDNFQLSTNNLSALQAELDHAGEDARAQALLKRLESRRITSDKKINPIEFLFQMFCKPCFPRGELVALSGKAKSGKTFVSSILMSLCYCNEVLTIKRLSPTPLRVLWFDTEQSEESTQNILNSRIIPMFNSASQETENISAYLNEKFHIFNVRADFWQERLPLLEAAITEYKPDLVILDGIRDLVNDINDGIMAQDVIERLMRVASNMKCCIVCVLHQNKSLEDKTLRGCIGTELKNKAFEGYECSKDADRIFTLMQTDTRKYDIIDRLKYTVDSDGIPQLCSVEELTRYSQQSERTSSLSNVPFANADMRPAINDKYLLGYKDDKWPILDIPALFTDAFKPGEIKTGATLQGQIMNMTHITSYKFYNSCRLEAMAQGVIIQSYDPFGHVQYACPLKPSADNDSITFDNDQTADSQQPTAPFAREDLPR